MKVYEIDPLQDERWEELLARHPQSSVFHTRGWLEALQQTYGYIPIAFTTSSPANRLENAISFCEVSSWLSGRRLVSLPFSDHCEPLVDSSDRLPCILSYLRDSLAAERWNYIEIRPRELSVTSDTGFSESDGFLFHKLNLGPCLNEIYRNCHKDCVQRKIQRAAREALAYEEGRSEQLLSAFYKLLLMTRRRHGVPAQPIAWFRNLIATLGKSVKIRVAYKNTRPVASIVTIRHKQTLVYKYGCSDERFNSLGGTQLLFWRAIQEAKEAGLSEFDMGRSDLDEPGLVAFKDRWGAARSSLVYFRFPGKQPTKVSQASQAPISKYLWSHAPTGVLAAAGKMLYRHMG